MTTIGWIILLILVVPALGLLAWVLLSSSFVRIPSGRLGLVMFRGRPTGRPALQPGAHFVPTLWRRTIEVYPSIEMSFRAGGSAEPIDQEGLDSYGPPVELFLGDRTYASIGYTIRYRLMPDRLRRVHERFGPQGISGLVRDESAAVITMALGRAEVSVDDLYGSARQVCQEAVAAEVGAALAEEGIELTALRLRSVDLGRTGDAIQAAARARHDLEQENAAAAVRLAAAGNDLELQRQTGAEEGSAWRYREMDLWRELILRRELLNVTLPGGARLISRPAAGPAPDAAAMESGAPLDQGVPAEAAEQPAPDEQPTGREDLS